MLAVINGQKWGVFDPVKWSKEKLDIPAYMNILVLVQLIFPAKIPDLMQRLKRGHHNLRMSKPVHVFFEYRSLLPAMGAVGTEQHDDYRSPPAKRMLCYPMRAVFHQQAEGRKCRIPEIGSI